VPEGEIVVPILLLTDKTSLSLYYGNIAI